MGDSVSAVQFRDGEGPRAVGSGQQRQRDLVRWLGEIAANLPETRVVMDIENADAVRRGIKVFQRLAQRLGGVLAGKSGQSGECAGHGGSLRSGRPPVEAPQGAVKPPRVFSRLDAGADRAGQAGAADAAIAARVLGEVLLVVVLGKVEGGRGQDFGCDRAKPGLAQALGIDRQVASAASACASE
jgi:hypothetical protein